MAKKLVKASEVNAELFNKKSQAEIQAEVLLRADKAVKQARLELPDATDDDIETRAVELMNAEDAAKEKA